MSGYSLCYSPEAIQDLNNIADYIILEFANTDSAARTIDNIMSAIDKLVDFPRMGAALSSITGIESDYRFYRGRALYGFLSC